MRVEGADQLGTSAAIARALAMEIAAGDAEKARRVTETFAGQASHGGSLAEVYKALQ